MIEPKVSDIGKRVIYSPPHHLKSHEDQRGYISSYNPHYVFVRFDGEQASKACQRRDLYWEDEEGKAPS